MNNQKIVPYLWFDKEAKEAADFYTSLFPDSKVTSVNTITGTPSGDCDIVSFELWGLSFQSISAGPYFKFNPSISLMVNFDSTKDPEAVDRIDRVWKKLSDGGKVLMPLDKYPFSQHFGWVQDKYGLSWQLMLKDPDSEDRSFIVPHMLFVGDVCGKAEEASDFYISIFKDSKRGSTMRHPAGAEPDKEGTIMFTDFKLGSVWFSAMDSAYKHDFSFNEAISFMVKCDSQEEIDYYWEKLSAVPESEQCGWLKDKFGVSWQIVPTVMDEMMASGNKEKVDRLTQAFLKMKKFNIDVLQKAFNG